MATKLERAWLSWARDVITDGETLRECDICPTSAGERMLWPGYIGEDYRSGGVLFVGAVHNRDEFYTAPIVQLATIAKKWAYGETQDDTYLSTLRHAYRTSIAHPISGSGRAWIDGSVWRALNALRDDLGLDWSHIAFTNWSKCATPVGAGYDRHIRDAAPSFERLPIKALKPRAIFICCGTKHIVDQIRRDSNSLPMVRVFGQRGYGSKYPDKLPWREWRINDIAALRGSMA